MAMERRIPRLLVNVLRKRTSSRSDLMMIRNRIHLAGMLLGSMLLISDACLVQFAFHCASHSSEHRVTKKKRENSTIASGKVGVPLMPHRRRTSERREEEHHTGQTAFFLLAPLVICHTCWCSAAALPIATGVIGKGRSVCHTHTLHCELTQRHTLLPSRDIHSYTNNINNNDDDEGSRQACKLPNSD